MFFWIVKNILIKFLVRNFNSVGSNGSSYAVEAILNTKINDNIAEKILILEKGNVVDFGYKESTLLCSKLIANLILITASILLCVI